MEIWNTKYCLTSGITKHKTEPPLHDSRMVFIEAEDIFCAGYYLFGEGTLWHRSKELAVARAEEIRIKKLKSLERQIKKIRALVF